MSAKVIPSIRHERAIPDLQRKGFAAALRKHTGFMLGTQCRIVPDAFEFNVTRQVLTLYEAEVTHFIAEDSRKLEKLRIIRDCLPLVGWRLRVRLSCSDGVYYPMDWDTGRAKTPRTYLRSFVRLLDRGAK